MNNIPKANLEDFTSKNSKTKKSFVKKIGIAFQEIGFLVLKGHFLSSSLQENLYKEIRNFFNLSDEIKSSYEIKDGGGQRGYTGFGKESAAGRSVGDLKEFWHFGQDLNTKKYLKKNYAENIKVKELENFNQVGNLAFLELEKTAKLILQALALFLNIDEFYFDKFVNGGNSILRAIHYPPIKEQPKEAERAAAHSDINLITLLMGAQGGGLEVLNRKNHWIEAVAEKDELIINIGDMLSRLTNNFFPSTLHRVVNPAKEFWGSSRYSVPFFMHPIPEMPLNCLPQTYNKKNLKKYDDILAGEFLNQRLKELGLIKN